MNIHENLNSDFESFLQVGRCIDSCFLSGGLGRVTIMAVRRTSSWTDAQLKAAMDDVHGGSSIRAAAAMYGIPRSSLHDHLNGKSTKRFGGPQLALPHEIEKEIVESCFSLQELGFPMTKDMVGVIIHDYLEETGTPSPFINNTPGRWWWEGFLKRWPKLTERKPQHLPKIRALSSTPEVRKI